MHDFHKESCSIIDSLYHTVGSLYMAFSSNNKRMSESQLHAPQTKILEGRTKPCVCVFEQAYAPQTTILEGRSNIRERIFKSLFK